MRVFSRQPGLPTKKRPEDRICFCKIMQHLLIYLPPERQSYLGSCCDREQGKIEGTRNQ